MYQHPFLITCEVWLFVGFALVIYDQKDIQVLIDEQPWAGYRIMEVIAYLLMVVLAPYLFGKWLWAWLRNWSTPDEDDENKLSQ